MQTALPNGTQTHERTVTRVPQRGLQLAMLLAGTLLVGFSMGSWLAPLAAWIGPVLLMRFTRDNSGWRGYLILFAACTTSMLIGFSPMWMANWGPAFTAILAVVYGLLWSLPYLADRLLGARLDGFWSTLAYPLAATTLEFVNIHSNPVGMWGATGFSQYGNLALMQLASVTGMIGITFLMGWFASTVNWFWENQGRGREVLRGLAAFGTVFAIVYLFGFLRLNLAPSSAAGETIRVAGITAVSFFKTPGITTATIRDAYLAETVREAQAGAKVVFWNELAGTGPASDDAALISRAQQVARQYGIYLGLPLGSSYPNKERPLENKLLLIDPTGAVVMEHVKYGGNIFEGSLLGDGKLRTVATPFGVLSGAICYDLDFPAVIQQAGLNGTGLMLVPSADWIEIDPIHAQMAVFRAVENGMSLVRQTYGGRSIAVDPYGRELAQVDFYGATDRTLVAQVPVKHVATIYTSFGRWLEWLCPLGLLVVVARALGARRAAGA